MIETEIEELISSMEEVVEMLPYIPEKDCKCHISPPCSDCVENSGLREALAKYEASIEIYRQRLIENKNKNRLGSIE